MRSSHVKKSVLETVSAVPHFHSWKVTNVSQFVICAISCPMPMGGKAFAVLLKSFKRQ